MSGMVLKESRRLTGPNLIMDGPGAILEIEAKEDVLPSLVPIWRKHVKRMLKALEWGREACASRSYAGGVSLVISAPPDVLYAATEVNEWAWEVAAAEMNDETPPDFETARARLTREIQEERNPRLMALKTAAEAHAVTFLSDDEWISVGLGKGSRSWPVDRLPDPQSVPWDKVFDIPVALITGTNGKSTTIRLLAAIAAKAGLVRGFCSTDWIGVGDRIVESGDFSGPGGARSLLRERDVEIAFLETARGGILRRGLAVNRADVALVTNVAEDHLGEYGIDDLEALVRAKLVVAKAIGPEGFLVLNADNRQLKQAAAPLNLAKLWFSLHADHPLLTAHIDGGGDACYLDEERLVLVKNEKQLPLMEVTEVPVTMGGAARHNIANALAAIGVAAALDLPSAAIIEGLREFHCTPETNPGRGNLFEIGGVKMLVDFAHNPHGISALMSLAAAMPAQRRLVVLGQAGDRDDAAIRGLARNAWKANPDCIILKEMSKYLRGRAAGEIPAMMEAELLKAGAPSERIIHVGSELEAVQKAVAWSRPGDFLLLVTHGEREAVFEYLNNLKREGWQPKEA